MVDSMDARTCRVCHAPVAPEAQFCSGCGSPLSRPATTEPSARPKWYYNIWFVLVMLFLVLGPFGLPLVWKNPRFSRMTKILLTGAMVLYTLALVGVVVRAVGAVMEQVRQLNSTFPSL